MKKNRKNILIVVLLLLLTVTASFAVYTYAKYTSTVNDKSGSATVAKWDFVNDNQATLLTSFRDTYDSSTLVAEKIAPGTKGSFKVKLVNTRTEVGVSYSVKVGEITGKPTNLKFYSDAGCTNELMANGITGTLAPKDSTGVDVAIYWKWEYQTENGDAADTSDGESAGELSIPISITGTQVQPTVTP